MVLPDHLHALFSLPEGDADFSGRWQRRFWEHLIRHERDYVRYVDYLHFNPVKHAYVKRVRDWPHSTFHRFVREGHYASDWAGGDMSDLDVGEKE